MQRSTQLAQFKAAEIYNATATLCDKPPLAFWARTGQHTVDKLTLTPGSIVLDVCCGTGVSALPAAERVGPKGRVLAIDVAEQALQAARKKAARQHLSQLDFRLGDMTDLGLPGNTFDAVICVFGIFFAEDMEQQVQDLWRLVGPGGQLAITTWGLALFEPVYSIWLAALACERAGQPPADNPWDRLTSVDAVATLLKDGGAHNIQVIAEDHHQRLRTPDDWWTVVRGSGLRGAIDQLEPTAAQRVRDRTVGYIRQHRIQSVETNVIYGMATKSSR